jgi:hypothetical protein
MPEEGRAKGWMMCLRVPEGLEPSDAQAAPQLGAEEKPARSWPKMKALLLQAPLPFARQTALRQQRTPMVQMRLGM